MSDMRSETPWQTTERSCFPSRGSRLLGGGSRLATALAAIASTSAFPDSTSASDALWGFLPATRASPGATSAKIFCAAADWSGVIFMEPARERARTTAKRRESMLSASVMLVSLATAPCSAAHPASEPSAAATPSATLERKSALAVAQAPADHASHASCGMGNARSASGMFLERLRHSANTAPRSSALSPPAPEATACLTAATHSMSRTSKPAAASTGGAAKEFSAASADACIARTF
mmetsp:Transcript_47580/g.112632  ORF Transcript_47580/g.112632 Transcript_47580/m.112632 type:complete len:237 (+) Transcript_47580:978-1688(+)